jgi:FSR family fosmidomycin resistance protein-like MFS transporter
MQATLRGRYHYAGRETTAASIFFMFGQVGLFMGPLIAGPLLEQFGLAGLLIPAGLCLPISLNVNWQLRHVKPDESPAGQVPGLLSNDVVWFIAVLAILAALQAWAQQNMITFLPKYLSDLGISPGTYGLVSGLFMGGSALGNLLGGNLADRFGKLFIARIALTMASVPLMLVSLVGWSPWLFVLVPLSGLFTGAVHSIVVVMAQRYVPGGMGLASGLTLGFMFSAGALGTLLSGPLADARGIPVVFQVSAVLVLLAALITVPLQRRSVQLNSEVLE